jgi:diadenosine tetraphosphate (Ap4A) HIT family hydrolase
MPDAFRHPAFAGDEVLDNYEMVISWIAAMSVSHPPTRPSKPIAVPVFGSVEAKRIVASDKWFIVIRDKYPLTDGHCLIIPRREAVRFQDLKPSEKVRLLHWIGWTQNYLEGILAPPPDGFNLGINDGKAAGQTIGQFHFHVIPRYQGDVPDPRGGIRWVMPSKARYWARG